jgi:hypothetical protein
VTSAVPFGVWVRRRRRTLDLTQQQLGELVSCATVTVRKIETGERRPRGPRPSGSQTYSISTSTIGPVSWPRPDRGPLLGASTGPAIRLQPDAAPVPDPDNLAFLIVGGDIRFTG